MVIDNKDLNNKYQDKNNSSLEPKSINNKKANDLKATQEESSNNKKIEAINPTQEENSNNKKIEAINHKKNKFTMWALLSACFIFGVGLTFGIQHFTSTSEVISQDEAEVTYDASDYVSQESGPVVPDQIADVVELEADETTPKTGGVLHRIKALVSTKSERNKWGDNSKLKSFYDVRLGYADLVADVMPAVVTVSTKTEVEEQGIADKFQGMDENLLPFFRDFFDQLNKGKKRKPRDAVGLGSGFIIRSDGFILTNYHVVKGAKSVTVTMKQRDNESKDFKAVVYAYDEATDLALVKIKGKNFPTLTFADSDKIRAGDLVIAIGNPFGLSSTVSSGIVSAISRNIHMGAYDNFIQTDTAINQGNSGGPMIDIKGHVMGINTAIYSTAGMNGGSIGIGFAIPSNTAVNVIDELLVNKTVVRGYLGVVIQPITDSVQSAFKLPNKNGVLIADTTPKGPADVAGVVPGDIVIEIAGKKIKNVDSLRKTVSAKKPGSKLKMKLIRKGKVKTVVLVVTKRPSEKELSDNISSKPKAFNANPSTLKDIGIKISELDKSSRDMFRLPPSINHGVVIMQIQEGSIAESVHLSAGMVIMQVNGVPVHSIKDLVNIIKKNKSQDIAMLIYDTRFKGKRFISITKDDWDNK